MCIRDRSFGQIHVTGGFLRKPLPVQVKVDIGSDGKNWQFIKMASTEYWLTTATCGPSTRNKLEFGRTSLINTLRQRIQRLCDGIDEIDHTDRSLDIDDPMDELELDEKHVAPTPALLPSDTRGRVRYYQNKCKHAMVTVNLPSRPPELEPNCTSMRAVRLFIEDRQQVWLHVDDVAWAVEYLFHQVRNKGVSAVPANDPGPSHAAVTIQGV